MKQLAKDYANGDTSRISRKPSNSPAATAEPMTPATFGAIACISRWLSLSNSRPTVSETLAESGTAETPALPISGFILCPSLRNRFINFAKSTPLNVAMTKEMRPSRIYIVESCFPICFLYFLEASFHPSVSCRIPI